jgi:hypothetical protein
MSRFADFSPASGIGVWHINWTISPLNEIICSSHIITTTQNFHFIAQQWLTA